MSSLAGRDVKSAGRAKVVIIGSGAGGATTALEFAKRGLDVVVLEEGAAHDLKDYGADSPTAMKRLYRRRGMTPILGKSPIGYVEGCCVGGSTEINSGFWHRTPRESLARWRAQFDLEDATLESLTPHFEWAESALGIGLYKGEWPQSTKVFARGIEAMGWAGHEIARAAPGCQSTNACAMGCPTGAKQGMSRSVLKDALAAGARLLPNARAKLLLREGTRVTAVLIELHEEGERGRLFRLDADYVFVCAGPTETPSLLRRSGLRWHIGDTLRIHPMLKVVARFEERIDAQESVLPLLQVREFAPEVSLGGGFFSFGHAAMALGESGREGDLRHARHMASYYVAVRGRGHGQVRSGIFGEDETVLRYELDREDVANLSNGLARLSTLLLAAGAREVIPAVSGMSAIRTERDSIRWLDDRIDVRAANLTTVHAFSSCPIGEHDRCAANSFGKVKHTHNLYVNDASMLPDSPGVNPQGTVMALARRNALRFLETLS